MSRIYELIAIGVIGLGFFFAGVIASGFIWTSEIEQARDWERGYVYGYRDCQYDHWKKFGIPIEPQSATTQ